MKKGGWQPIETAPKDGTEILACIYMGDGVFYRLIIEWNPHYSKWDADGNLYSDAAFHSWRPLPPDPPI